MKRTGLAWLVFLLLLAVYLLTLTPTLGNGRSAAWVTNALFSGLPEAPGNLFYLLVSMFFGKLYQLAAIPLIGLAGGVLGAVPGGARGFLLEPAVAVNAISALSGAGAAALFFLLGDRAVAKLAPGVRATGGGVLRGLPAALLLAGTVFLFTMPSLWVAAVTAGPQMFNLFLLLTMLWLLVRVEEGAGNSGMLLLGLAYLLGISFSEQHLFLFGALLVGLFLLLGRRTGRLLRASWLPMLGLFLLGLTVYCYLAVRPVEDPGLGLPVSLLSGEFRSYFLNFEAFKGSFQRQAGFFAYQLPLFFQYLQWQAQHPAVLAVLLALPAYGLVRAWRADRRLCGAGLVLLLAAVFGVLWLLDPKLGFEQAWEQFPEAVRHESSHIDYLFLPAFLAIGAWAVFGLLLLYRDLEGLLLRLEQRLELASGRLAATLGIAAGVLLIAALLAPVYFRWLQCEMSAYHVKRDLGRNLLAGTESEALVVLRGDDEFYPAYYAGRFPSGEAGRRSLINYHRLGDSRYVKWLRRMEPAVPLTYEDAFIDRLGPIRLAQPESFESGRLQVIYPAGTVFLPRDILVLDILRANAFQRPVYFSSRMGEANLVGLGQFLAGQGLLLKLSEQDPAAGSDSVFFWRRQPGLPAVSIPRTTNMLWMAYQYRTTAEQVRRRPRDERMDLLVYARSHVELAEAFLSKGNAEAAAMNFRQVEFFDTGYQDLLFSFATRFAQHAKYKEAKEFAASYFQHAESDPLKWAGLAKIALDRADTTAATELLLESVKVDPHFQLGFLKLVRLYDAMGQKVMASAFLSTWAGNHPNDVESRKLWEDYTATQTLPPGFQD